MKPTFSVNATQNEKHKAVQDLIKQSKTVDNTDWLSEAYIKIVEGKEKEIIDFSRYSSICEKNARLTRQNEPLDYMLTEEELAKGYKGVSFTQVVCGEEDLDAVVEKMDNGGVIEQFLDIREQIYYEQGSDIWRLIELVYSNDRNAPTRLRNLIKKYSKLEEVILHIMKHVECLETLQEILG